MPTKTGNSPFDEFVKSPNTVRVYKGEKLIFSSRKPRLLPLLEYARSFALYEKGVTVFDRLVGNAAALQTLDLFGIKYHFNEVVDCIMDDTRQNMCPMGKRPWGKLRKNSTN